MLDMCVKKWLFTGAAYLLIVVLTLRIFCAVWSYQHKFLDLTYTTVGSNLT